MKFLKIMGALFLLALTGCTVMKTAGEPPKPSADQAQVVFVREGSIKLDLEASLYDVTTSTTKYIGHLGKAAKLSYSTSPGKHVFMVVTEAADFMEADLDAGKTYYAMPIVRMGAFLARFSLYPVSENPGARYSWRSKDFDRILTEAHWVENTPESFAWYEKNKEYVEKKHQEYWPVWQRKTPEALAERTLKPNDGRAWQGM